MSNIEITNVEDVREGDEVTVTRWGVTVTGPVVGEIRYRGGENVIRDVTLGEFGAFAISAGLWEFVKATRPRPSLPTEPYSVITDVVTDHGKVPLLVLDEAGLWCDAVTGEEYRPGEITSFTLAKVVPA